MHLLACETMRDGDLFSLKYLVFLNEVFPCESFYNRFLHPSAPYESSMPEYLFNNLEEAKRGIESSGADWNADIGPAFFRDFLREEKPILIKPYPFGTEVAKIHQGLLRGLDFANHAFLGDYPYYDFLQQIRVYFRPPYEKAVEESLN